MTVDERRARSVALEQTYVHDIYEQLSPTSNHSKPWPKVEKFLEDLEPGSIVCDVGCGNGKYLNVNPSIFNVGAERSCRLSQVARDRDNEIILLDNLSLPFRDESLDAVLSIAVIHHFATTERRVCALRELARVLRIGGKLIISVWAMEQNHRKFESQDVLVPWYRPKRPYSPSSKFSSASISECDLLHIYHGCQNSDSESNKSFRSKGKKKSKSKRTAQIRSNGTDRDLSHSTLSSPNETCYSFLRKALQKLSGARRIAGHRPWFLDHWTNCTKISQEKHYDPDGCECYECLENMKDLPIELRRIDNDDNEEVEIKSQPKRRLTLTSSNFSLITDISDILKSKSMTNIKTGENVSINSQVSKESVESIAEKEIINQPEENINKRPNKKPKLVKQKKSINEDDIEILDGPQDTCGYDDILPEIKPMGTVQVKGRGVLKQRSLNEEFMSIDRLQEKEQLRKNIQKQTSLNEEYITQRHVFDSFRESFFISKKFQLIKMEFTNKIKNSTTNIEKVTGTSLKNGFVRIFQNWKTSDLSPTIPENESMDNFEKRSNSIDEKKVEVTERRHSKEDGSDSSKDSSLQSDTSVDSEDSFASVIFVPKSENMSPILSPGPTSPRWKNTSNSLPSSPKIKQSSCPTSPRLKQLPLALYPLTKQMSNPKPSTDFLCGEKIETEHLNVTKETIPKHEINKNLLKKYTVQQIPKFKKTSLNTPEVLKKPSESDKIEPTVPNNGNNAENCEKSVDSRNELLKKIKDILSKNPDFGVRKKENHYPIVRRTSIANGKVKAVAKALPKFLYLELFNPEVDDLDSDSSCMSSPDSIESVINTHKTGATKFNFAVESENYTSQKALSLLEAAAQVADTLDETVERVINSNSNTHGKSDCNKVVSIIHKKYEDAQLLTENLESNWPENWNQDCHKHLTDFADQLSEKLIKQIDYYQETSVFDEDCSFIDPYIHRLSEELNNLSKISSEIQKQNEYLKKLSAKEKRNKCSDYRKKPSEREPVRTSDINNERSLPKTIKNTSDNSNRCAENSVPILDRKLQMNTIDIENNDELINKSDNSEHEKWSTNGNYFSNANLSLDLSKKENRKISNASDSTSFSKSTDSTDSLSSSASQKLNTSFKTFSDKQSSEDAKSQELLCSSNEGSTASLTSCPEWRNIEPAKEKTVPLLTNKNNSYQAQQSCDEDIASISACKKMDSSSGKSNNSMDSLQSENSSGGEITYHRYYHVFREGELDSLIEKYVENLHIISSYYDRSSWCIIAEKVRVWTI